MPRGRRGRRRSSSKKKRSSDDEEEIDTDPQGEAGETVVHVQCPWCKKLFKNRDDICPYCEADITTAPKKQTLDTGPEGLEAKHISIYVVLILTIFSAELLVYYILMPDPGSGFTFLGFLFFPFALFLTILMVLFFIVMKREKITKGIKDKLIISTLMGLFVSCLVIGVGRVGQFLVDEGYQGDWARDADTIHNLFIISALLFLILLVAYFFFINYQKRKTEEKH